MKELIELAKEVLQEPKKSSFLIERFIKKHDFPIVNEQRATFFYWDGEPVDEVLLMHWVSGLESRQPFKRLPGTHAFWLSIHLTKELKQTNARNEKCPTTSDRPGYRSQRYVHPTKTQPLTILTSTHNVVHDGALRNDGK